MSDIRKTVDARGLACPQPVILTRKALAEGGFELLEVLVDDPSSRENVVRFAGFAHCGVEAETEDGGTFRILLRPDAGLPAAPEAARVAPAPETLEKAPGALSAQGATVFIASGGIGTGDEQLAALLMRGFLYTLTEAEGVPRRIILMNGGVRLAVEGSDSLVNLRRLAERGVEILACGTCLEFYQLREQLAVGRVSNLYEIAGLLLQGRTLSL
jgi:selenium metabolism protein YedF